MAGERMMLRRVLDMCDCAIAMREDDKGVGIGQRRRLLLPAFGTHAHDLERLGQGLVCS